MHTIKKEMTAHNEKRKKADKQIVGILAFVCMKTSKQKLQSNGSRGKNSSNPIAIMLGTNKARKLAANFLPYL